MARVMRDTTVAATAEKLFGIAGPSWQSNSYNWWNAVVKAWAAGATRIVSQEVV